MSKHLSPQDLRAHRETIVSEVRVVLAAYFQPSESPDVITAQLAWWADELQDWTREQVVWALRKWNRDEPSRRPTPGHILAILKAARGKKAAERNPAPKIEERKDPRVTADEASAILEEYNFAPKRFGGDA